MTNVGTIVKALRDLLANTPSFVTAIGGDAARIKVYYHSNPSELSRIRRIQELVADPPGALVLSRGFAMVRAGGGIRWAHRIEVLMALKATSLTDVATTFYAPLTELVDGLPSGSTVKLSNTEIVPSCDPMTEFDCHMAELPIESASNITFIDYWEATFNLLEKSE